MLTSILYGIVAGFLASCSLGVVFFSLIQAGLSGGIRKGLPLSLGVLFGDCIYVCFAIHFSEAITQFIKSYEVIITIIGALVFFGVGIFHIFNHHQSKSLGEDIRFVEKSNWGLFVKGLAINMANPVNIAIWLGLYNLPPASGFDYTSKWVFGCSALSMIFISEMGIAWGAGKIKKYLTDSRLRLMDLFLGLLFIAMGLYFCYIGLVAL